MLLDELPDTRVRDRLAEMKQADETTLFDWEKSLGVAAMWWNLCLWRLWQRSRRRVPPSIQLKFSQT